MSKIVLQYSASDLPTHFRWQMLDFARIQWHEDITHEIGTSTLHPDKWHPTYFILLEGDLLISAATVLWKTIMFQEQSYKMYGLGMVLTYPTYRKRGYGRQVVATATEYIQQDTEADMALLQTAPHLEHFYSEQGWEHTPNIQVLSGHPDHPIDDEGWIMMLILSDRAKQHRQNFEKTSFYLDEHIW